jgi:CxxC motif-containing protein (DUF1111 family)
MRRVHPAVYVVLALLALTPVALRAVAWWRAPRPQPLDPALAAAGEKLFRHEWTPHDPLANGGDGLGPVFNANSCVACHSQGGVGGSGGVRHNVTLFSARPTTPGARPREGVIHSQAVRPEDRETLDLASRGLPPGRLVNVGSLPGLGLSAVRAPANLGVSQRNTPALFGARLIDQLRDEDIIAVERRQRLRWGLASANGDDLPVGRASRLPNGRVGHFGWKGQSASLADFVQAACANELGLGNPGQAQPRPLGRPDYQPPGLDLTLEQCNQLTAFVAELPRPVERLPDQPAAHLQAVAGKKVFQQVGCADCHTPDVGSVEGIYSDLLLHRMGEPLQASGGGYNEPPPPPCNTNPSPVDPAPVDGPSPGEWRTPPLWGVADSAPYLHDGRASTLEDAIKLHGGQAARAEHRFEALGAEERAQLVAFLKTLRAP